MRMLLLGVVCLVVWAQVPPTPAVFTEAQAAAGRTAYLSSCVTCHTESLVGLDGTGEIPEYLRPYAGMIPPLAGSNAAYEPFLTTWGTRTTQQLSQRIREAVGGFPPKDKSQETYLDLTAYVLQVNGAKPGSQPLTKETAVVVSSLTATAGR